VIPLSSFKEGQSGVVREVNGGRGFIQRLAAMGIFPGTEIRVVKSGGPVIVEHRGHRLVLGRGMVDRVMVEPRG